MFTSQTPKNLISAYWASWILIFALAVITRPFRGIHQDGNLYAAQAMERLNPGALKKDMFFAYGNQDSFTAFSYFYAPLIDAIGLFEATQALWVAGLLFWTGALIVLVRTLMPTTRDALISAASVLCLYAGYGNMQLSYAEAWVTPRQWAEALCMIAIAAAFQRRVIPLAASSLFALMLHPLIALSGITLAFWLLCPRKRTFFATSGAVLAVVLGVGAAGVDPFSWAFQQIDTAWWSIIKNYVQIVQVGAWWHIAMLVWLPMPLISLWLVWRHGAAQHRDLIAGIVLVGGAFTLLSFLFTDLMNNQLFTALQLWRAEIWIALFGNLFAWSAYCCLPKGKLSRQFFGAALVLTAVPAVLGVPPIAGGFLAAAALLIHASERNLPSLLKQCFVGAGMILLLAGVLSLPAMAMAIFGHSSVIDAIWQTITLVIVSVGLWCILKSDKRLTGIGIAVCLPFALIAADKRTDREVYLAAGSAMPQLFADRLRDRTIYWQGELAIVWFGLNMPNYYSCQHLSGAVFHRLQALEVVRRGDILSVLKSPDISYKDGVNCPHVVAAVDREKRTSVPLMNVCAALPDLDFIVLEHRLNIQHTASWTAPFSDMAYTYVPVRFRAATAKKVTPFYLYSCKSAPP